MEFVQPQQSQGTEAPATPVVAHRRRWPLIVIAAVLLLILLILTSVGFKRTTNVGWSNDAAYGFLTPLGIGFAIKGYIPRIALESPRKVRAAWYALNVMPEGSLEGIECDFERINAELKDDAATAPERQFAVDLGLAYAQVTHADVIDLYGFRGAESYSNICFRPYHKGRVPNVDLYLLYPRVVP